MVWAPLRNDVQTGPDLEPVHASALESCQPSGPVRDELQDLAQ